MKMIKPERVAGIVALSYLVLIPAGAFVAWQKLRTMDQALEEALAKLNLAPQESPFANLKIPTFRGFPTGAKVTVREEEVG